VRKASRAFILFLIELRVRATEPPHLLRQIAHFLFPLIGDPISPFALSPLEEVSPLFQAEFTTLQNCPRFPVRSSTFVTPLLPTFPGVLSLPRIESPAFT